MSERRGTIEPFELDPSKLGPARIEVVEESEGSPLVPLAPEPPPARPGRPWLRLLVGAGALSLLAVLGFEAWQYVAALFDRSAVLGGVFAILFALTAAGGIGLAARELWSLRKLARVEGLRDEARRLIASDVHGQAEPLLGRVERLYADRSNVREAIERFERQASDALDDGERLRLFASTVLAPLDRRAYQLVKAGARDIGALTALSPLGLLDGLIVLVRTLAMLRAIAQLYGVRPGVAATAKLLRRAIRNVVAAGVGELLSDAAVETVGASVLSVLSARAGQGVVNGLLAAKLGLTAMQLCRPLPFTADELPSLRQLRAEIFEQAPG